MLPRATVAPFMAVIICSLVRCVCNRSEIFCSWLFTLENFSMYLEPPPC